MFVAHVVYTDIVSKDVVQALVSVKFEQDCHWAWTVLRLPVRRRVEFDITGNRAVKRIIHITRITQ